MAILLGPCTDTLDSVLVPTGTVHPLPVPSGTGSMSHGAGGEWDVCQ